ncbi:sensor histidine kinase (plasmid) [Novosphingobium sp. BL-8A]
MLADVFAPNIGAFALVYPAVLIAVLFGRLAAGITALLISFTWACWLMVPVAQSTRLQNPSDIGRIVINALSVLIVLVLAEAFRRAVREAVRAYDVEIERRKILMAELEHRTKNNFALVASLLSLQARKNADPMVSLALEQAIGRIRTFAQAYENLTLAQSYDGMIAMRQYVHDVVSRAAAAMLPDHVSISIDASERLLPQQVAVAIGLFFNEALTNCAKYAFPEGRLGQIRAGFRSNSQGWEAFVIDNGVGETAPARESGTNLGRNLMSAFAQQAQATYCYTVGTTGCHVSLRSECVQFASPPDAECSASFKP